MRDLSDSLQVLEDRLSFDSSLEGILLCKELYQSSSSLPQICKQDLLCIIQHLCASCSCKLRHRDLQLLLSTTERVALILREIGLAKCNHYCSSMEDLLNRLLTSKHISGCISEETVLKCTLVCDYNIDKDLIDRIVESSSLRRILPCTPGIFFSICGTMNTKVLRSALNRLGQVDWDVMLVLQYLCSGLALERAYLRFHPAVMPRKFEFTSLVYEPWVFKFLIQLLRKNDLLLACLHLYECIHLCYQHDNPWYTALLMDIDECVGLLPHEHNSWYETKGRRKQDCLRYMMFNQCMQLSDIMSSVSHSVLRQRRLDVLYKLKPQGKEYFNLWITYWADVIRNLRHRKMYYAESSSLACCEMKFRFYYPSMSHWVLFIRAASQVIYEPSSLSVGSVIIDYVHSSCTLDDTDRWDYLKLAQRLNSKSSKFESYLNHIYLDIRDVLSTGQCSSYV